MSKWKTLTVEFGVVALLISLGVAGRLLPHPANFTPVAAAALFAGFFLRSRLFALAVPVVTMLISNYYEEALDPRVGIACIVGMCVPVALRGVLNSRLSAGRLLACSLVCSLAFFLISNTAVWLFAPIYTLDFAGLVRCYSNALPFLRNTLVGDLTWTAILFGTHALLTLYAGERFDRLAYLRARK